MSEICGECTKNNTEHYHKLKHRRNLQLSPEVVVVVGLQINMGTGRGGSAQVVTLNSFLEFSVKSSEYSSMIVNQLVLEKKSIKIGLGRAF